MKPITVIDIGASGGYLAPWKNENIKVIGFEPDERSFAELKQGDTAKYFNIALWKEPGVRTIFLTKSRTDSSLLRPNTKIINNYTDPGRFDVVDTKEIKVDKLDNFVKEADFLKIDTQGSELEILKGGENLLAKLSGIEIEVEFIPIYEDQHLFWEINDYLKKFGFYLCFLRPHYWKLQSGLREATYADAIYIKDNELAPYICDVYKKYYNPPKPPLFDRVLNRARKTFL